MFSCIICNNKDQEKIKNKVRDSNKKRIVKCTKCNHIQLYPTMTKRELKNFYDNDLQVYNVFKKKGLKSIEQKNSHDVIRRYNQILKMAIYTDRILEVGSGYGFFLKKMLENNYAITGIEISKYRRKIIEKSIRTDLLNLDLNYVTYKNTKKFDLVVMFQVLEHIHDPIKFLKNVKKTMKKKAKIVIEVPNVNDFQLKINKEYDEWFWQSAHVNYFSPETLRNVLEKAKFQNINIKGIQRYSIENMFHWKLLKKPQLKNTTYELEGKLSWIDKKYKKYLEKYLISDTLFVIASN